MKILPIVNEVKNDITASGLRIKTASIAGYSIANRTAQIYKQSQFQKYINISRSISGKIAKNTTTNEMPYIAAAIGMFIPLPLMTPIFFLLRLIVRYSVNSLQKMYKK